MLYPSIPPHLLVPGDADAHKVDVAGCGSFSVLLVFGND
jgi:hypothetical protein